MKTKNMILYALFAALTVICSMIFIPLPFTPVPINLATLAFFLAGGLLGAKGGAISQLIYVLLGAIGLPVFSGFTGGFSIITGPTGGYIIGYMAGAFITGLIANRLGRGFYKNILGMTLGLAACYTLGTIWFMHLTSTGFVAALMLCVVPFLIGDGIKIVIGSFLVNRLHKFL